MKSERTKWMMVNSLKKLMRQKPLNRITIREIVEDCGVNRQTFYYHFGNIYDMVAWMYREEALNLLKQREGADVWSTGLRALFHYIEDNWEICLCALRSTERDQLSRFYHGNLEDIVKKTIDTILKDIPHKVPEDYVNFITHFYTISLSALVESWLNGEISLTADEIVNYIDITLGAQIRGALAGDYIGNLLGHH
ncbi:MAG: TetR/AcrR family transcriptional regulator C-terminal domain-containing protein [Bacillota bacterium]|nr:TetR/AcrR family transcriptional regulator C-terminal domain-containing protein [Bacillota bacterium]